MTVPVRRSMMVVAAAVAVVGAAAFSLLALGSPTAESSATSVDDDGVIVRGDALGASPVVVLADALADVDADLLVGAVEGGPEPAARVPQAELAVRRLAGIGDHAIGEPVVVVALVDVVARHGRQRLVGGQPVVAGVLGDVVVTGGEVGPGGRAGAGRGDGVVAVEGCGVVGEPWFRRHRRRRGLEHPDVVAAGHGRHKAHAVARGGRHAAAGEEQLARVQKLREETGL